MYIEICGIRLRVGFFAALFFALAFNVFYSEHYVISLLSVLLHECTHLLCMVYFGCTQAEIRVLPGGIRISSEGFPGLGYAHTVFCTLSAPAVNLLLGLSFLLLFYFRRGLSLLYGGAVNLLLGAVNLLPLSFLDGGKALENIITMRSGKTFSGRAVRKTDIACTALIGTAVICLSVSGHFNPFLLAFFLYSLLGVFFCEIINVCPFLSLLFLSIML